MSEYRVEQSDDGWYVMRRGGCWASCSSPHDAERIARALAVLDAMERDNGQIHTCLVCGPECSC